jgi:hypothetical protein
MRRRCVATATALTDVVVVAFAAATATATAVVAFVVSVFIAVDAPTVPPSTETTTTVTAPDPSALHVSNNMPTLPEYTAVISPPFATVLEGVGGPGGDERSIQLNRQFVGSRREQPR